MKGITERMRQELDMLIENGAELTQTMGKDRIKFMSKYHEWYTRSLAVVHHLLPDRLAEFERLYHAYTLRAMHLPFGTLPLATSRMLKMLSTKVG